MVRHYIIFLIILILAGFTYWYVSHDSSSSFSFFSKNAVSDTPAGDAISNSNNSNEDSNLLYSGNSASISASPDGSLSTQESPKQIRLPRNAEEFVTDWRNSSIDLGAILPGGPLKDGIPALTNPEMIPLSRTKTSNDTLGIFVEFEHERRWYGYDVLLYHEVVNDTIGNTHFAITYCPLCGSALVFDRTQSDTVHEFGVSGWLFESNMLMYDKATESLWSQAGARAIVGEYNSIELKMLPLQVLSLAQVKSGYSDTLILSRETGHENRLYGYNPYGNYDEREEIIYPVSYEGDSFPAKTLMVVIPRERDTLAVPLLDISEGTTSHMIPSSNTSMLTSDTLTLKRENGVVTASVNSVTYPHYVSMYFSFAIHHLDDGVLVAL